LRLFLWRGSHFIQEHDDISVTTSDDVDVTSASTTTDLSITEPDSSIDDKSTTSSKNVSPTASRGPVLLLRRQPNPSPTTSQSSRQATPVTGDVRQPSPVRIDTAVHTPVKETIDPSLSEAFANPMNRQYLLQLEASLNSFVTQSRSLFAVIQLISEWIH
jgi:hypothetical protein